MKPKTKRSAKSWLPTAIQKKIGLKNSNWIYGVASLLFLMGLVLILKNSFEWGLAFSILGLTMAVAYMGLNIADLSLDSFFTLIPVSEKLKRTKSPEFHSAVFTPEKGKKITPSGLLIRASLVLAALILGVKGQTAIVDLVRSPSQGLTYYLIGVTLFLVALWPWQRERLKLLPISPSVEWALFGLIFALAAFLRVYKLDTIPSGIFFDMGFQGYSALRILHEHWRPWELNITADFPSAPIPMYAGALWFIFFKNTQFNLNLFYVVFCLASFPLIYWTFRQLSGPRVALLALYILAVMRWNMTFCRNSFPPSLLPFFMFGTLALLLYGLRTRKRWPFPVAGLLFAGGLYSYQTYVMFLIVIFLCGLYECVSNWKAVKANTKMLVVFLLVFAAASGPFFYPMLKGQTESRFRQLSIFERCKQLHSIKPLLANVESTALMFNRQGDGNARHNLQLHRQLDDITGFLFFFGFFYVLTRCWRRKHFYTLVGLVIMALPCLITIDPAHSSRMHGMTAFVALASASALSALWGRSRAFWGFRGEITFLILLSPPLVEMAHQNFHTYFVEQANNNTCFLEFSIAETAIGKHFAQYGDKYECYVSPRYYRFFTISYLTYFQQDHIHPLLLPDCPAKLPPPGCGLYFALEEGRTGVLDLLKTLYPGGEEELDKDLNGHAYVYFYRVPPEKVEQMRGLKAEFSNGSTMKQIPNFPLGLPEGPYHATFTGTLFIDTPSSYKFSVPTSKGSISWSIGSHSVLPGKKLNLAKGYYGIKIGWDAPEGSPHLDFSFTRGNGERGILRPANFNSLPYNHGLKGSYYNSVMKGEPKWVQWDPVINYENGNDFAYPWGYTGPIRWSGTLHVPKTGTYFIKTQSYNKSTVQIDGLPLNVSGETHLLEGPHDIEIVYLLQAGQGGVMSLFWTPPGSTKMEVIPNRYFGETH